MASWRALVLICLVAVCSSVKLQVNEASSALPIELPPNLQKIVHEAEVIKKVEQAAAAAQAAKPHPSAITAPREAEFDEASLNTGESLSPTAPLAEIYGNLPGFDKETSFEGSEPALAQRMPFSEKIEKLRVSNGEEPSMKLSSLDLTEDEPSPASGSDSPTKSQVDDPLTVESGTGDNQKCSFCSDWFDAQNLLFTSQGPQPFNTLENTCASIKSEICLQSAGSLMQNPMTERLIKEGCAVVDDGYDRMFAKLQRTMAIGLVKVKRLFGFESTMEKKRDRPVFYGPGRCPGEVACNCFEMDNWVTSLFGWAMQDKGMCGSIGSKNKKCHVLDDELMAMLNAPVQKGDISARVVRAEGLVGTSGGKFSPHIKLDPFLVLLAENKKYGDADPETIRGEDYDLVNDGKARTTIKYSNNPVWNEQFDIAVYDEAVDSVFRVLVYDYDMGNKNEFVGFIDVPVKDLAKAAKKRAEAVAKRRDQDSQKEENAKQSDAGSDDGEDGAATKEKSHEGGAEKGNDDGSEDSSGEMMLLQLRVGQDGDDDANGEDHSDVEHGDGKVKEESEPPAASETKPESGTSDDNEDDDLEDDDPIWYQVQPPDDYRKKKHVPSADSTQSYGRILMQISYTPHDEDALKAREKEQIEASIKLAKENRERSKKAREEAMKKQMESIGVSPEEYNKKLKERAARKEEEEKKIRQLDIDWNNKYKPKKAGEKVPADVTGAPDPPSADLEPTKDDSAIEKDEASATDAVDGSRDGNKSDTDREDESDHAGDKPDHSESHDSDHNEGHDSDHEDTQPPNKENKHKKSHKKSRADTDGGEENDRDEADGNGDEHEKSVSDDDHPDKERVGIRHRRVGSDKFDDEMGADDTDGSKKPKEKRHGDDHKKVDLHEKSTASDLERELGEVSNMLGVSAVDLAERPDHHVMKLKQNIAQEVDALDKLIEDKRKKKMHHKNTRRVVVNNDGTSSVVSDIELSEETGIRESSMAKTDAEFADWLKAAVSSRFGGGGSAVSSAVGAVQATSAVSKASAGVGTAALAAAPAMAPALPFVVGGLAGLGGIYGIYRGVNYVHKRVNFCTYCKEYERIYSRIYNTEKAVVTSLHNSCTGVDQEVCAALGGELLQNPVAYRVLTQGCARVKTDFAKVSENLRNAAQKITNKIKSIFRTSEYTNTGFTSEAEMREYIPVMFGPGECPPSLACNCISRTSGVKGSGKYCPGIMGKFECHLVTPDVVKMTTRLLVHGRLDVSVHQASGLPEKADTFVDIRYEGHTANTEVIKNSKNPIYDSYSHFNVFNDLDQNVYLSVMKKNMLTSPSLIGEAVVPISDLITAGDKNGEYLPVTWDKEVELRDEANEGHGGKEQLGKLKFKIRYTQHDPEAAKVDMEKNPGTLYLDVLNAEQLLPLDRKGMLEPSLTANPFAVAWVDQKHPDLEKHEGKDSDVDSLPANTEGDGKYRTAVKNDRLNPKWDQQLILPVRSPDSELKIRVLSYRKIRRNQLLGRVTIPIGTLTPDVTEEKLLPLVGGTNNQDHVDENGDPVNRGKIHLKMRYELPPTDSSKNMWHQGAVGERLQVSIIEAKGLRSRSLMGKQDLYVNSNLGLDHQRTPTLIDGGTDPIFNADLTMSVTPNSKVGNYMLEIYNERKVGPELFVGRVEIPMSTLTKGDEPIDGWYPVKDQKMKVEMGALHLRTRFLASGVGISANDFPPNVSKIGVHLGKAHSLHNPSLLHDLNPYVKITIKQDGEPTQVKKSRTVKYNGSDDPDFMSDLIFSINPDEVNCKVLIQVYTEQFGFDPLLGEFSVPLATAMGAAKTPEQRFHLYNPSKTKKHGELDVGFMYFPAEGHTFIDNKELVLKFGMVKPEPEPDCKMFCTVADDPYIIVSQGRHKFKTTVKKDCGKECDFGGDEIRIPVTSEAIQNDSIRVQVVEHEDFVPEKALGEFTVSLGTLAKTGTKRHRDTYSLKGKDSGADMGSVVMTSVYTKDPYKARDPKTGKVSKLEAIVPASVKGEVEGAEFNDPQDAYVVITTDKNQHKVMSKKHKNGKNVKMEYKFDFETLSDNEKKDDLVFKFWDWDKWSSHDLIGSVKIPFKDIENGKKEYDILHKEKKEGVATIKIDYDKGSGGKAETPADDSTEKPSEKDSEDSDTPE